MDCGDGKTAQTISAHLCINPQVSSTSEQKQIKQQDSES
jgi:hypothetical protein